MTQILHRRCFPVNFTKKFQENFLAAFDWDLCDQNLMET